MNILRASFGRRGDWIGTYLPYAVAAVIVPGTLLFGRAAWWPPALTAPLDLPGGVVVGIILAMLGAINQLFTRYLREVPLKRVAAMLGLAPPEAAKMLHREHELEEVSA